MITGHDSAPLADHSQQADAVSQASRCRAGRRRVAPNGALRAHGGIRRRRPDSLVFEDFLYGGADVRLVVDDQHEARSHAASPVAKKRRQA
jgi:hypothetical protein